LERCPQGFSFLARGLKLFTLAEAGREGYGLAAVLQAMLTIRLTFGRRFAPTHAVRMQLGAADGLPVMKGANSPLATVPFPLAIRYLQ